MTRIIFLISVLLAISAASLKSQTISPPSDLEARPKDTSYIEIKWHDNSSNEEGFYIERAEVNDSASWEVIDAVPQNVSIYYDYWVTRGNLYYYRVFAYRGLNRSGYSNIASAILLGDPNLIPTAPTNLTVQSITTTSITIGWQDNATNENGFIIARKNQNEPFFRYIDTVGTDILTYQEVGLTPDNIYIYKVCAFNNAGISDYTNTVNGRTKLITSINYSGGPKKHIIVGNSPNPFNPTT
ncbi:MAG: fibronectin type III domain-containing protein, partial [bacterium]